MNSQLCEECEKVNSELYCIDCKLGHCIECSKKVHGMKSTKGHTLTFDFTKGAVLASSANNAPLPSPKAAINDYIKGKHIDGEPVIDWRFENVAPKDIEIANEGKTARLRKIKDNNWYTARVTPPLDPAFIFKDTLTIHFHVDTMSDDSLSLGFVQGKIENDSVAPHLQQNTFMMFCNKEKGYTVLYAKGIENQKSYNYHPFQPPFHLSLIINVATRTITWDYHPDDVSAKEHKAKYTRNFPELPYDNITSLNVAVGFKKRDQQVTLMEPEILT